MNARPRLAVLADPIEEGWPSMDLAAEMLVAELRAAHHHEVEVELVRPRIRRIAQRARTGRSPRNIDRVLLRFAEYPLRVSALRRRFDFFHIADHSYAQLACLLPADRTGVYCHDVDTFRCLREHAQTPRAWALRGMAELSLRGLRRARHVFHSTRFVREEIERHQLVERARLVLAPLGVAPEFIAGSDRAPPCRYLLNVGSESPRKRLDVLCQVFMALARHHPELRLVQIGAVLPERWREELRSRGLLERVMQPGPVTRLQLAEWYRGAALVMLPSEREGFGLPLLEALACGAPVIASDIPPFREVAGEAALFCAAGDVEAFAETARGLLEGRIPAPALEHRLQRAREFSWRAHAGQIWATYRAGAGAA